MKKLNLLLFFSILLFISIYTGCNNNPNDVSANIQDSKNANNNNFIKDSLLDFSKNQISIKISSIGKMINTGNLRDDIHKNLNYYAGIYAADTIDINKNGVPEFEQFVIKYYNNEISAYIIYYENGIKQHEYKVVEPEISAGYFKGFIIENDDKEILTGKFVYYLDDTLPNGKLAGIVLNRKGKLAFYSSVYSNGIQNLF